MFVHNARVSLHSAAVVFSDDADGAGGHPKVQMFAHYIHRRIATATVHTESSASAPGSSSETDGEVRPGLGRGVGDCYSLVWTGGTSSGPSQLS